MHQDCKLKHNYKSTFELLQNKMKVFEWLCHLIPIEMYLKQAVHTPKLTSLAEISANSWTVIILF